MIIIFIITAYTTVTILKRNKIIGINLVYPSPMLLLNIRDWRYKRKIKHWGSQNLGAKKNEDNLVEYMFTYFEGKMEGKK